MKAQVCWLLACSPVNEQEVSLVAPGGTEPSNSARDGAQSGVLAKAVAKMGAIDFECQ